jgi:hypothetical protein
MHGIDETRGRRWRPPALAGLLGVTLLLGGCSGADLAPDSPSRNAGLGCIDDSPRCIAERKQVLDGFMADKTRSFVRQAPTPTAYASGVRLWAFKSRKRELTCEELGIARREADAAAPTLRGPGGAGMTQAQISRGIMLAQDVGKELGNEHGRRCRG